MEQEDHAGLAPCEFMASNLIWRVDVIVASTVEAITPIVDKLMQLFRANHCPPRTEFALEMLLREAIANSIIHGNRENPRKHVRICCAYDPNRGMLIIVKDQGEGFDLSTIPNPLIAENVGSEHGRGIYLINMLTDEVEFRRGGTEIYIRKDIHTAEH